MGVATPRGLVIVDRYREYPGATPLLVKRIVEGLAKRGYELYILSTKILKGTSSSPELRIFETSNYHYFARLAAGTGAEDGFLHNCSGQAVKVADWLHSKSCDWDFTDTFDSKKNFELAKNLVESYSLDFVLSFSHPFSAHRLASRLKGHYGTRVKWAAYEFDPYAFNHTVRPKYRDRRRAEEQKVLADADLLLLADGIEAENTANGHLTGMLSKTVSTPLPGLEIEWDNGFSPIGSDGQTMHAVFTGQFYAGIRSPEPLLTWLDNSKANVILDVYGAVGFPIRKIFKDHPIARSKMNLHGFCSREECVSACRGAQVLINVDNDISNQVPSKLFGYMSCGRPILNFYKEGCGLAKAYLSDYPNVLNIDKEKVDDTGIISLIDEFCAAEHRPVAREEVEEAVRPFSNEAVIDKVDRALGMMLGNG